MENKLIKTNVDFLDKQLKGGLSNGINLIGSLSGVGKTSLSMMICKNISKDDKKVLHITSDDNAFNILKKYCISSTTNNIVIKEIKEYPPKIKDILSLVNDYSIDIILIDELFLSFEKYHILLKELNKIEKPIILTTQLKRDLTNGNVGNIVYNIELLYAANVSQLNAVNYLKQQNNEIRCK